MGPQKTDLKGFKGFGFGAKPGGPGGSGQKPAGSGFGGLKLGAVSRPGAPVSATPAKAKAKAKASGVSALFQESMDKEEEKGSGNIPSWDKITPEAAQAHRNAEALMAEDPSVFQYDEVLDDLREEAGLESGVQKVRAEGLVQKKRVGLVVPEGAQTVQSGVKRTAKYIEKVMVAVDRRSAEQQIVEDKLLQKEKEKNKDSEVFVTAGFKEELKRRKKFEDELDAQDARDAAKAADKQENGAGFASMYRNLLNGGLATSRGGEKVKELAPARQDIDDVGQEVKDEIEEKVAAKLGLKPLVEKKEEKLKDEIKDEAKDDPDAPNHGVEDVKPLDEVAVKKEDKAVAAAEDKEKREEKALSAKERYLLRKKGLA